MQQTVAKKPKMTLAVLLATGLGVGLKGPMPGTVGALWGLPIAWAIAQTETLLLLGPADRLPFQSLMIGLLVLLGVPICTKAGKDLGNKKDNQAIVWDEFATVPMVFLFVPLTTWSWPLAITGFILHRIFDISKIPPAKQLEELPEGYGVMLDDVSAGMYGAFALWGLSLTGIF